MKDLRGKNALVTGASRGIGAHVARALAREGMRVALVARDGAALDKIAGELAGAGARAVALPTDLGDVAEHERLYERATRELGEIDVLINNAAIDAPGAFTQEPPELTTKMIHLDLVVPMLLTRRFLPAMLARRSGHVVNVASLAGKSAAPFSVSYSAAKGGLISFSHSLRAELRGTGVTASVVTPGFITGEGMFAAREREHGLRVPAAVGTSTPGQVAHAIVRALRDDRAEILVSPGPVRLLQAFNQLAPDTFIWLVHRLGIADVFRGMALSDGSKANGRTSP